MFIAALGSNLDTTQMPFKRWTVKQTVVYLQWNTTQQYKGTNYWDRQHLGWISRLKTSGGKKIPKGYILYNSIYVTFF